MRSIHRLVGAILFGLVLTACLTAGPGGCSSEEAAAFNEISHYREQPLVPVDHPYGICGAVFTSDDDPDGIIEHYQTVLRDAGWTVHGSESGPITEEGGGRIGTSVNLGARKGPMTFSLGAEVLEGTEPTTFNVLVGESD